MSLQQTPRSNRLHIGVFGRTNSGKSSLVNAITGQQTALVSEVSGTTADPVYKSMEIHGLGPCVLIDTAGFDDRGELGPLRMERTEKALEETDLAILVFSEGDISEEIRWLEMLRQRKTPVVAVINRFQERTEIPRLKQKIRDVCQMEAIEINAKTGEGVGLLREELLRLLPNDFEVASITGHLVKEGDVVLLVMPQDIQAPRGRLILPQVQTIRDLLDQHCLVMSVTTKELDKALASLVKPPELIITDSQVFSLVYEKKPAESRLTSFSILMAGVKGDLKMFVEGAAAIDSLQASSRILIAEACTHAPLQEDIGREKIPRLLRSKFGAELQIDVVSGKDFPDDLTEYDLIIHCGGCMFNRKYLLSRLKRASDQGVPITNYGVVLAKLTGILDKVSLSYHGSS